MNATTADRAEAEAWVYAQHSEAEQTFQRLYDGAYFAARAQVETDATTTEALLELARTEGVRTSPADGPADLIFRIAQHQALSIPGVADARGVLDDINRCRTVLELRDRTRGELSITRHAAGERMSAKFAANSEASTDIDDVNTILKVTRLEAEYDGWVNVSYAILNHVTVEYDPTLFQRAFVDTIMYLSHCIGDTQNPTATATNAGYLRVFRAVAELAKHKATTY